MLDIDSLTVDHYESSVTGRKTIYDTDANYKYAIVNTNTYNENSLNGYDLVFYLVRRVSVKIPITDIIELRYGNTYVFSNISKAHKFCMPSYKNNPASFHSGTFYYYTQSSSSWTSIPAPVCPIFSISSTGILTDIYFEMGVEPYILLSNGFQFYQCCGMAGSSYMRILYYK